MKIALVIYQYSDSKGGVERYVSDLAKGLISLGQEVHVFCHKTEGLKDEKLPDESRDSATLRNTQQIVFHHVPVWGKFYSPFKLTSFANNSAKILAGESFDIIQGFGRTYHQDILRFGSGCHWEYLKHTHLLMKSYIGRLLHRLNPRNMIVMNLEKKSMIKGNYKKIICISNMVKQEIMKYYKIPDNDAVVIHNAVDLKRFTPDNRAKYRDKIRQVAGIKDNDIALLFVGSGFERKGLASAIEGLALTKDKKFRLLVIGKGNEPKYKFMAKRLGVCDRVIFLGAKSNIQEYYAASDIFIFPSLYDAFGTVALEGMASGLPSLVSKFSGASEVVTHEQNAFVIDPDNPPEIARYLNELINPAKREEMGKAAVQTAQKYDFKYNLEGTLQIYAEVMKNKT
jgi:UDP-glucose:(heptosyl)LPS alpha-1,3-glucosyltransferase